MLFVIDIGNTTTVIGIYKNNILLKHWSIRTNQNRTEDEFGMLVSGLLTNSNLEIYQINKTIISCVVPGMVPLLNSFCNKYTDHSPYWIDNHSYHCMPLLIDNPNELGADRIANSVAAYSKYMTSIIVVDFGTATTFDVISDKGEYLGGAISPGIMISSEALFKKTSKLPRVDIYTPPKFALGKNTISSMQSGIVLGYVGLVDTMVKRLSNEILDTSPKVIATGGLSPLMFGISDTIDKIEPLLTLEGLKIISENFESI